MKNSNLSRNLFLALIMLVGMAVMGVGIFFTVDRNQKMKTYETVRGGIVDYQAREGDNGMLYGAVYAYEVDGKEYNIYDDVFTNKVPRIGERVEVMYDPAAPGDAFVKGTMSTGFFMLLLGGLFFAVPLFLLIGTNYKTSGKWMEGFQELCLGLIFAGMGYGLCFGLKQGITFVTVFLFLFGSVGIYIIGLGVYTWFRPEKQMPASVENTDLQQNPYYVPDEQHYQEDALKMQLLNEQREKIDQIKNKIEPGVRIARGIQKMIGGIVISAVGGYAISIFMSSNFSVTGLPLIFVILFLGIFVVLGMIQIVKGILEIVGK